MQRDVPGYVYGVFVYQYAGSNPIVRTDPTGGCQDAIGDGVDQGNVFVNFSQQHRPGVWGQFAAIEIALNLLSPDTGKRRW